MKAKGMEEIARIYVRHLLGQVKEVFTENWILKHLLYKSNPNVKQEHWEQILAHMKTHPDTKKKIGDPFDAQSETSMKKFEDQMTLVKTQAQLAEAEKEIALLEKKFIDLFSQLPPPKFPN